MAFWWDDHVHSIELTGQAPKLVWGRAALVEDVLDILRPLGLLVSGEVDCVLMTVDLPP